MTPTQYTSLEVSNLIASKVEEVDTGAGYIHNPANDTWMPVTGWSKEDCDGVPRYRLDDVIRAIKVLSQKGGRIPPISVPTFCNRLLTVYLPSLSVQDPEVEKVIREVFE